MILRTTREARVPGTTSSTQATCPFPTWAPRVTCMCRRCFHAPLPICCPSFEQNGRAERHGKARATAVSWPKDTCPRGAWHKPCRRHVDESRGLGPSTPGVAHARKGYFVPPGLSCVKQRGHEKGETVENPETGAEVLSCRRQTPGLVPCVCARGRASPVGGSPAFPFWVSPGVVLPSVTRGILGEAVLFL